MCCLLEPNLVRVSRVILERREGRSASPVGGGMLAETSAWLPTMEQGSRTMLYGDGYFAVASHSNLRMSLSLQVHGVNFETVRLLRRLEGL